MDENDLLEMGRTLAEKYKQFEQDKKNFEGRIASFQRYMVIIYTYARELDMLIDGDSNYPLIIRFMIERIRGLTSQILFKESQTVEETFEMFLQQHDP